MIITQLWLTFLVFLRGLSFVSRWTATLERSLKSEDSGRLHLHAFMEFHKAPDWETLDKVQFEGICPNREPFKIQASLQLPTEKASMA